mmetsp:Transcript_5404/g.11844  ORF Transcript_5404/g.11844 Transcript_5404/m.11844 type:complete len:271 (-) Transcript_5404:242-1054(-)
MRSRLLLHRLLFLLAHPKQLLLGHIPKRPSARRQNHPPQTSLRHALQTLKNGRMLRIGREHVDSVFFHQRVDDGSSRDERFLIGQCNVLAEFDGLDGGKETRGADDSRDHRVGAGYRRRFDDALVSIDDVGHILLGELPALGQNLLQFLRGSRSGKTRHLGTVFQTLFGHESDIGAGGEGVDDEVVGASVDNVEGLSADGAGGAEDGDAFLEGGAFEGFGEGFFERGGGVDGGGGVNPSGAGAEGTWDGFGGGGGVEERCRLFGGIGKGR